MSSARPFILSAVVLGLLGCGGSGEYRRTGGTFAARGPDCQYRVIRNRIVEPYKEVGVVDIDAFSVPQLPIRPAECDRCRDGNIMRRPKAENEATAGGEG
ncbi:MAG: hypothetical protein HKN10_08920 [Myxococcales bacterium]|nr:hypothetical protein [Myxococcales bacterium]